MAACILVSTSDPQIQQSCLQVLKRGGYTVSTVESAPGRYASADLVLYDLENPCPSAALDDFPAENLLLISKPQRVTEAVHVMEKGAQGYILSPITPDELLLIVKRTLGDRRVTEVNHSLKTTLGSSQDPFVGKSPEMGRLRKIIGKIAPSHSTVLIQGESGTGKELVAQSLHKQSPRADRLFIPINCGGLPEPLLESELFGHAKGAFTGAYKSKAGLVEVARGGTIFLDEIGDVSPAIQVKLLRILEDSQFFRVGATVPACADVRFIAATNRNLREAVKSGDFRKDLYYRLNVLTINVAPLRTRRQDIALLLDYYLFHYSRQNGSFPVRFSEEALECLLLYDYPGNIRELKNIVERCVVLAEGPSVSLNELPEEIRLPDEMVSSTPDEPRSLREVERDHIRQILENTAGHRGRASRILQINRRTLYEKIRRYEL